MPGPTNPATQSTPGNNEGVALLLVAFATVVIVGAATVIVDRVYDSKRQSDAVGSQLVLDEGLKGAIDLAIGEIWSGFDTTQSIGSFAATNDLPAYRNFLDSIVENDAVIDLAADAPAAIGAATIERLTVARDDRLGETMLTIEATATSNGWIRTASQTVAVGGESVSLQETQTEYVPPAFPDQNGNRIVDKAEFEQLARHASGSVTGHIIDGQESARFTGTNIDGIQITRHDRIDDNVILLGSENAPLRFEPAEGTGFAHIAVDGDLAIKGRYQGNAQLLVRGNVYILGDLTPQPHEEASLTITAGGAILIGDYLTRSTMNDGTHVDVRASYSDDANGYFAGGAPDLSPVGTASYGNSAAMAFNHREYTRARKQAGYVPRYYRLRPGANVWMYESAQSISEARYADATKLVDGDLVAAAVLNLAPDADWISEQQLRRWWFTDELSRPDEGRALQVSAVLHTANAILGHARPKQTHNSNTLGQIEITGRLLANDIALHGDQHGVTITESDHAGRMAKVQDHTRLTLQRLTYRKT